MRKKVRDRLLSKEFRTYSWPRFSNSPRRAIIQDKEAEIFPAAKKISVPHNPEYRYNF